MCHGPSGADVILGTWLPDVDKPWVGAGGVHDNRHQLLSDSPVYFDDTELSI